MPIPRGYARARRAIDRPDLQILVVCSQTPSISRYDNVKKTVMIFGSVNMCSSTNRMHFRAIHVLEHRHRKVAPMSIITNNAAVAAIAATADAAKVRLGGFAPALPTRR